MTDEQKKFYLRPFTEMGQHLVSYAARVQALGEALQDPDTTMAEIATLAHHACFKVKIDFIDMEVHREPEE